MKSSFVLKSVFALICILVEKTSSNSNPFATAVSLIVERFFVNRSEKVEFIIFEKNSFDLMDTANKVLQKSNFVTKI